MSKLEEIKRLKSLLNQGAISQDEFMTLKKNVIGSTYGESDSKSGFNTPKFGRSPSVNCHW
jgi:hypothetical protein